MTTPLFLPDRPRAIILRVQLNSTLVAGGLTGLTYATAGLIISTIADREATATVYTAVEGTIEPVATLGTYEAPSPALYTLAITKCRFQEVDATNHPGLYEVQLANGRWTVPGAQHLALTISGAANLQQADFMAWLRAPIAAPTVTPTVAPIPARAGSSS